MRSRTHPNEQSMHSGVAEQIIAYLAASAGELHVADVRIGLGYTAAMLADSSVGLACTFRHETNSTCTAFDRLRPLVGRPASDLLDLLSSPDRIEAGIGLATANALANHAGHQFLDGDVLANIDLRGDDRVAMVGHFAPLVDVITEKAQSLTVFEMIDRPDGLLRPAEEAKDAIPTCQVVLITATAIINHTIDELLKATGKCREVVVLGASTPLLPEVFINNHVTMLSGVLVKNPQEVLRVVSEGGGTRLFSPHVRKVSFKLGAQHADVCL
jgi:uncharacterized protein (DUF4213/DUF364 family)